MSVDQDVVSLEPGTKVVLFEIDLSPITGTNTVDDHIYLVEGLKTNHTPIVWQTKTYNPWPIEAEGFEVSSRGSLPRPNVRAGNVGGTLSALCIAYQDLVGAMVIRRQTFAKYLDGEPGADPNQHLPDDVFFIERKLSEDYEVVAWELASAMDLQGQKLPNRIITKDYCWWEYRSAECSYAGTSYFSVLDLPVASLALDVCSHRVSGCKARFGAKATLPFGGFPAARAYKI